MSSHRKKLSPGGTFFVYVQRCRLQEKLCTVVRVCENVNHAIISLFAARCTVLYGSGISLAWDLSDDDA